jgi:hypothetical protein
MYLRQVCDDPASELACDDDSDPPGGGGSQINVTLGPGTYYLFVDGYGSSSGPYDLNVDFTQEDCVDHSDCDDGLFCNGAETCNVDGSCEAGTPPCDDGDPCSQDTCFEYTSQCEHTCIVRGLGDPCCDQPICSQDPICQEQQYSQTANTVAGSHGGSSLVRSGVFNSLVLVLIPIGVVILLRVSQRRK